MNERDNELFEAELRRLVPASPPPELMARLATCRPASPPQPSEVPIGFGVRQSSGALAWGGAAGKRQRTGALQDAAAPNRAFPQPSTLSPQPLWWFLFRWLAPVAAAVGLVGVVLWWLATTQEKPQQVKTATASLKATPGADDIEIDRQLVALFDAVAQLPNGQPVRFRCREWTDEVVFRDPDRGLVIESRTPRLEVIPVRFETY